MDMEKGFDLSTLTAAPELGGGGTDADQSAPIFQPLALADDGGASQPASVLDVAAASPSLAPSRVTVIDNSYVGNAMAAGRAPSLWDKARDAAGAVQVAFVSPFQTAGRAAATAAGASPQTVSNVGAGLLPVVLAIAAIAAVIYWVRKGRHGSVSL